MRIDRFLMGLISLTLCTALVASAGDPGGIRQKATGLLLPARGDSIRFSMPEKEINRSIHILRDNVPEPPAGVLRAGNDVLLLGRLLSIDLVCVEGFDAPFGLFDYDHNGAAHITARVDSLVWGVLERDTVDVLCFGYDVEGCVDYSEDVDEVRTDISDLVEGCRLAVSACHHGEWLVYPFGPAVIDESVVCVLDDGRTGVSAAEQMRRADVVVDGIYRERVHKEFHVEIDSVLVGEFDDPILTVDLVDRQDSGYHVQPGEPVRVFLTILPTGRYGLLEDRYSVMILPAAEPTR